MHKVANLFMSTFNPYYIRYETNKPCSAAHLSSPCAFVCADTVIVLPMVNFVERHATVSVARITWSSLKTERRQ